MRTSWWIVALVALLAAGLAVAAAAGTAALVRSRIDTTGLRAPDDIQIIPRQNQTPAPGGDGWRWMMPDGRRGKLPDGRWMMPDGRELPGPGQIGPGLRRITPTPQQQTPVPF